MASHRDTRDTPPRKPARQTGLSAGISMRPPPENRLSHPKKRKIQNFLLYHRKMKYNHTNRKTFVSTHYNGACCTRQEHPQTSYFCVKKQQFKSKKIICRTDIYCIIRANPKFVVYTQQTSIRQEKNSSYHLPASSLMSLNKNKCRCPKKTPSRNAQAWCI